MRTLFGGLVATMGLLAWSQMAFAEDQPEAGGLFAQLDTNKDGQITRDEVPSEKQRFFDRLLRDGDKDGNSQLSAEELIAGLQDHRAERPLDEAAPAGEGPLAGDRPTPEKMLERLDANGDGKLTMDEIPEGAAGLKKVLKKADTNNDAAVSKDELESLGKKFQKLTQGFRPEGGRGFAPELAQAEPGERPEGPPGPPPGERPDGPPGPPNPEEMFKQIDSNGDGSISKEEFAEHHKKMRERFRDRLPGGPEGRPGRGERFRRPEGEGGERRRPDGPPRDGEGRRPDGPPRDGEGRRRPDGPPRDGEGRRRGPGGEGGEGRRGPFGNPEEFFGRMDKNSDGKLTVDEAPEEGKERFERMMQHQDKDGDKAISKEEFLEAARQRRERMNRDGGPEGRRRRPGGPEGGPRPEGPPEGKPEGGEPPQRPAAEEQVRDSGRSEIGRPRVRAFFAQHSNNRPTMGPIAIFRILNTDGDDKLSDKELSAAGDKLRGLDRDKDGSLSARELFAAATGGRGGDASRDGKTRPDRPRGPRPDGPRPQASRRGEGPGPLARGRGEGPPPWARRGDDDRRPGPPHHAGHRPDGRPQGPPSWAGRGALGGRGPMSPGEMGGRRDWIHPWMAMAGRHHGDDRHHPHHGPRLDGRGPGSRHGKGPDRCPHCHRKFEGGPPHARGHEHGPKHRHHAHGRMHGPHGKHGSKDRHGFAGKGKKHGDGPRHDGFHAKGPRGHFGPGSREAWGHLEALKRWAHRGHGPIAGKKHDGPRHGMHHGPGHRDHGDRKHGHHGHHRKKKWSGKDRGPDGHAHKHHGKKHGKKGHDAAKKDGEKKRGEKAEKKARRHRMPGADRMQGARGNHIRRHPGAPFGRRGSGPPAAFEPGKMIERMTKALDANKDGKVSFDEFVAGHKKRFEEVDANKDGFIDETEVKAAGDKLRERMKQAAGKMRERGGPGGPPQGPPPHRGPRVGRPHGKPQGPPPGRPGPPPQAEAGELPEPRQT